MNDNIITAEARVCAQNYSPLPVVLSHGSGVWLYDINDNKYLDMMSAYSAVSHGHCNAKLLQTLQLQAQQLCITSRAFYTNKLAQFLEKLCDLAKLDMALPMNTGAEAVETAIKAARRYGYRKKNIPADKAEIIVCVNNFHGRTTTIISFSADSSYKKDFGPLTPGFKLIPFGDSSALQEAINPNTCAFLVEPIQGEAGIVVPPSTWLQECSAICREKDVLFIIDEIQSGLGRTGKLFAHDHAKIKPDGLILGKALGGGIYPVSAFLANKKVMEEFDPGSHGSTFGGNPLAASIGLRALELLFEDNLIENSAKLGEYLQQQLLQLQGDIIVDVRGLGLWQAVVLNTAKIAGREFCERLLKRGVLSKETHASVVRFAPPLCITQDELDFGLQQIKATLSELR